jgi:hypothetical protein
MAEPALDHSQLGRRYQNAGQPIACPFADNFQARLSKF